MHKEAPLSNMEKRVKMIGITLLVILVLIALVHPFLIIASLNTLFPMLSIPYNFLTYCATAFLHFCTFGYLHMVSFFKK